MYPSTVHKIFEEFKNLGYDVYLIGPRARQYILKNSIINASSFDLTTSANLEEIIRIFKTAFNVEPVEEKKERKILSYDIPTEENEKNLTRINIGSFRDYLPPFRSLKSSELNGIILDLATREITIQAFGFDINGELLDPFGGVNDLKNKIIRPVFPIGNLFKESGGWLLKIARYISRYGFEPHPDVVKYAQRDVTNIFDVPRDFWFSEMEKILCGPFADLSLQYMSEIRLLPLILPEVALMIGFEDTCPVPHKDLWTHTKQVIMNSEALPIIRWAGLFHDIGKVWTRTVFKDGKVHFFRHEDMGSMLFEGIAQRFKMDAEMASRILFIIKNHSRVNLYREEWSDSAIRRLIVETGDFLDDLIAFSKADLTSKNKDKAEQIREQLMELQIRIAEVKEKDGYVSPLKKGFGNLIMTKFNLPEGPLIGKLKKILVSAIENGILERGLSDEEYLKYLENFIKKEKEESLNEL